MGEEGLAQDLNFLLVGAKKKKLTGEKLQKRGMVRPYCCSMCEQEEDTCAHLLDSCNFSSALWDPGAMIFRRLDRLRHNPVSTLTESPKKPF